jgi:hypothetical protein
MLLTHSSSPSFGVMLLAASCRRWVPLKVLYSVSLPSPPLHLTPLSCPPSRAPVKQSAAVPSHACRGGAHTHTCTRTQKQKHTQEQKHTHKHRNTETHAVTETETHAQKQKHEHRNKNAQRNTHAHTETETHRQTDRLRNTHIQKRAHTQKLTVAIP